MAAFATVDELADAWRPLTDAEKVAAGLNLSSVASLIRREFKERLGLDEIPVDRLDTAKSVSIEIVKVAIDTGKWPGHIEYGRTEGPRSKTGTLAAPGGTLALNDWQREQLGVPVNAAPAWNFPVGDY